MGLDFLYFLFWPFVLLVSAGFGAHPIPEEVLVAGAGVTTAGEARFGALRWLMLPTCILGSVIADVVLYWAGRLFGGSLRRSSWLARLVPPHKREKTERNFHRYGVSILVIGRLVPGIRTTLFLTSGMMRLPLGRFLLADGIGAVLGNGLFFLLGFWLGQQFASLLRRLEDDASVLKPLLLLGLLLCALGYLLYQYVRRPIPTGDPEELPFIGHQVATRLPQQTASQAAEGEEEEEEAAETSVGVAEAQESVPGDLETPAPDNSR